MTELHQTYLDYHEYRKRCIARYVHPKPYVVWASEGVK